MTLQDRFLAAYSKWTATACLIGGITNPDHISDEAIKARNEAWKEYCDVRDAMERAS